MLASWQPCGLEPTRLFCPWNFPGKNINTGMDCHFLLQGDLPDSGIEPTLLGLLLRQVYSLPLCYPGSHKFYKTLGNLKILVPHFTAFSFYCGGLETELSVSLRSACVFEQKHLLFQVIHTLYSSLPLV